MLAAITGLLGVFVGGLIGNRLAIGRDRRKEFNEMADPIRSQLRNHIATKGKSSFVSEKDLEIFGDHMTPYKRKSYKEAADKYNSIHSKCYRLTEAGLYQLHNEELLLSTVNKLIKFTKRR